MASGLSFSLCVCLIPRSFPHLIITLHIFSIAHLKCGRCIVSCEYLRNSIFIKTRGRGDNHFTVNTCISHLSHQLSASFCLEETVQMTRHYWHSRLLFPQACWQLLFRSLPRRWWTKEVFTHFVAQGYRMSVSRYSCLYGYTFLWDHFT